MYMKSKAMVCTNIHKPDSLISGELGLLGICNLFCSKYFLTDALTTFHAWVTSLKSVTDFKTITQAWKIDESKRPNPPKTHDLSKTARSERTGNKSRTRNHTVSTKGSGVNLFKFVFETTMSRSGEIKLFSKLEQSSTCIANKHVFF